MHLTKYKIAKPNTSYISVGTILIFSKTGKQNRDKQF